MPAMDHKPVSNCLMIRCTNGHLVTQAHQNDFDVSGKKKNERRSSSESHKHSVKNFI